MPSVRREDGGKARMPLRVDNERRGPERFEPVDRLEKPVPGRIVRGEAKERKPWKDHPGGAVQHLGGRERLGVNGRGFLEFQRGLRRNRERRSPADDEERGGALK